MEGYILRQNGYLQEAIDMFTKGICFNPEGTIEIDGEVKIDFYIADSYYERGLIYKDFGKSNKAIKNLEKAQTIFEQSSQPDQKIDGRLVTIANALDELEK